jgi:hypothetical protein
MPNDNAHQETQRQSRARLRAIVRDEAVFAAFHEAIKAGHDVPMNRVLAEQFHCSEGAVCNSVRSLIAAGRIRSTVKTGGTVGKYRSVEILNSSAVLCRDPLHEPNGVVQGSIRRASPAPPLRQGTITQRGYSHELPPRGGRAATASTSRALDLESCVSLKTPPERVPGGIAPVVLSLTDGRSRNSSYSNMRYTPISIERARLAKLLGAGATLYAFKSTEGCAFPMWPNGAKRGDPKYGTYCGAPRCGEKAAYCQAHFELASAGTNSKRLTESPAEHSARIERGRKIRAGQLRAKALR